MAKEDDDLRRSLQQALEKQELDVSEVYAIALELAKNDTQNIRFLPDAGIIRRLGEELVSRKETAVAELVKNSYDADAINTTLTFSDTDQGGGSLTVKDNGSGMSSEELLGGFMRLAASGKIVESLSPTYHRQRAGRKGIGRFSVQRLGDTLKLTTKRSDAQQALQFCIDWSDFQVGRELSSIVTKLEYVDWEEEEQSGTILLIERLRDRWTEAEMKRVWRYVSDLIVPLPAGIIKPSLNESIAEPDPGFTVRVERRLPDGSLERIADEETLIWKYEAAYITATINPEGLGWWSITSQALPEANEPFSPLGADPVDPSIPFKYLKNISLDIHYFIYNVGLIPPMFEKIINSMAEEQSGVRLYRNGFRVWPYGAEGDDWLGIAIAEAKRAVLAPFGNRNFFGQVTVYDPKGDLFEETSSREGFFENEAFTELKSFAFRAIRAAVLRIAEVRDRKGLASGKAAAEEPPEDKVRKAIAQLSDEIVGLNIDLTKKDNLRLTVNKLRSATVELENKSKEQQVELQNEVNRTRVLASLGIVIGEFVHETRGALHAAQANASTLTELPLQPDPALARAQALKRELERVQVYTSYFDKTIRDSASRELHPWELGEVAKEFAEVMSRPGAIISTQIVGWELYTLPMHRSELESILLNFLSNSLKAIRRVAVTEALLEIRVGEAADKVYLEFADNGAGIPAENRDRVFNAFFTTTTFGRPFAVSEEDVASGSGLGLTIVQNIVQAYRGWVGLVEPSEGYTTCFRVELPKATKEQLNLINN